jgi:hypothetical protein
MKPILFNTAMVKAILDGKKNVTRRSIKFKYGNTHHKIKTDKYGTRLIEIQNDVEGETFGTYPDGGTWHKLRGYIEPKAPYKSGDIVYVIETWKVDSLDKNRNNMLIDFKALQKGYSQAEVSADFEKKRFDNFKKFYQKNGWQSPYFMPKEAARIFLKITDVRYEKVKNITCTQAEMEGVTSTVYWTPNEMDNKPFEEKWWDDYHFWTQYPQIAFSRLWDSTVSKSDINKYGWEADPWVWVIEFKRISKAEALQS